MQIDLRNAARPLAPSLPALPELKPLAMGTWRGRMLNEHTSATVFENLARQIEGAELESGLADECRSFAEEERRHGVLCGAVVEALGGEATFERPETADFPEHADVCRAEAVLRNAISICCMSETVAVALIGAERLEMPEGALRELLTRIYADEVGHARFGWQLVQRLAPSLDAAARARVGAYLEVAFSHLERYELSHINPLAAPPEEGVHLGLCNGRDARTLFYDTVDEVIVPGLEAVGLPAREAWRRTSKTRRMT